MQAIFSKMDEPVIKEEYIEPAEEFIEPAEEPVEEELVGETPKDTISIENTEEAQDNDTFENILKNKRTSIGGMGLKQENVRPDFSTDKPFYHGYYEKNDGEGVGWSTEMILFYKRSWGGEKFTVNDCIDQMDRKFS